MRAIAVTLWMVLGFAGAAVAALAASPAGPVISLPPGVPVLVGSSEAPAVQRGVADLRRDLAAVLGRESPVVTDPADLGPGPAIVVTCTDPATARLRDATVRGPEAHAILARTEGAGPRVVLQGADARGTLYAIYTFCDRFLDVPPLWFWASWQPAPRSRIEVPAATAERFGPADVPWRAWFPNDQDLLGKWGHGDGSVEARYEPVLEAMLRLKLNVIDVGSLSDYPSPNTGLRLARLAAARGLAVTTTHTSPFGASMGSWEGYWRRVRGMESPALSWRDPARLEEFWRYHIDLVLRERLEMIWGIGFRGAGDVGFFESVPDAPKEDAARARIIREMLDRQIALLRRATAGRPLVMKVVLYNENSDYFAQGLLRLPEDRELIRCFCSARRDHFPAADLRGCPPGNHPIGYYLNFQFTSTGCHLAQGEGPWKMARNFRAARAAGPLAYTVVNAGNIREFVLELAAHASMMWSFDGYDADRFLRGFCARYFGAEHAADAAALYRRYYDSYWQQRRPDLPGFERQYLFQDLRIARAGQALMRLLGSRRREVDPFDDRGMGYFRIVPEECGAPNQLEAVIAGTAVSAGKLDAIVADCRALELRVPESGRTFLHDNLQVQARFLLHANRWLNALARAVAALPEPDAALAEADEAAEGMQSALSEAAHGSFANWYAGDTGFNVKGKLEQTRALRRAKP